MAREAPEDRWAGLAPQDRLLHGAPPKLDLDDGAEVDPQTLRARALAAEAAARAAPGVTNSEGGAAGAVADQQDGGRRSGRLGHEGWRLYELANAMGSHCTNPVTPFEYSAKQKGASERAFRSP